MDEYSFSQRSTFNYFHHYSPTSESVTKTPLWSQPTPFIFVSKFREIHFPRSRLLWEKSPAPSTWGLTLHLWQ